MNTSNRNDLRLRVNISIETGAGDSIAVIDRSDVLPHFLAPHAVPELVNQFYSHWRNVVDAPIKAELRRYRAERMVRTADPSGSGVHYPPGLYSGDGLDWILEELPEPSAAYARQSVSRPLSTRTR